MNGTHFTRQFPLLAAISALVFDFLPAGPVSAASVIWDTPALISSDTDVSTTGSLLYAFSFGDTGVPAATVNGVSFAPFAVPTLTSAAVTVGNVSVAVNASNQFFNSNTQAGSASTPFASLSPAYRGLLQSGVATFNRTFATSLTLTLGELTIGQTYVVQFWSNDSSSLTNITGGTIYTSGNAVTLDNNTTNATGGVGQWVTGILTADSSTQVITLQSTTPLLDFPAINALQVRLIPEPSCALLLLPGVALLLRRQAARKAANVA